MNIIFNDNNIVNGDNKVVSLSELKDIVTSVKGKAINVTIVVDKLSKHILLKVKIKFWILNIDIIAFDITKTINTIFGSRLIATIVITDNRSESLNS